MPTESPAAGGVQGGRRQAVGRAVALRVSTYKRDAKRLEKRHPQPCVKSGCVVGKAVG